MQAVSTQELTERFLEGYKKLNAAQKKAVDIIDGPVMVIAGPGTGKTQILALRIANILTKTDTAPSSILALTFTESGVVAMRERLTRYLGARAYEVPIFTFHGFCGELIRRFPDAYQTIIGSVPASDLDAVGIIETILEDASIKHLRPTGDAAYYVSKIKDTIASLKREYITPDTLRSIIATQETVLTGMEQYHQKGAHKGKVRGEYKEQQKIIEKNLELLFVYRHYEAMLRERKLHDYGDMIVETVKVLTDNEEVRMSVQEQYQYVLADEHQDVNGSQNRILELLCSYHERPNIFVVGDEKQAIYRFQGASLENFLYFEDAFPHTTTISLTENYRSGQTILDVAHSLIAVPEGPLAALRIPLTAQQQDIRGEVNVASYTHQAVEDYALAESVKTSLNNGVPATEIAVITRSNREVERLAGVLHNAGIPVEATSETDVLTHPITAQILALIDVVTNPENQTALFTVLHGAYWGIHPADFIKIAQLQSWEQSLTAILHDATTLASLNLNNQPAVERVVSTLTRARERMVSESPQLVLQGLLTDSGLLQHALTNDPLTSGRVIRRMYDEVERLVLGNAATTPAEVAALLRTMSTHNLALTAPYIAIGKQAVTVMTAHKSKGLEFEHVFIPGFDDGTWGSKQTRVSFHIPITRHEHDEYDALDDERRLLYVALTRAKKSVTLSYAQAQRDGKERAPSRFLSELNSEYFTTIDTEPVEKTFNPLTALVRPAPTEVVDAALLSTLFYQRGFSATSFNNFCESPWHYLYRNILRIPQVQSLSMQFGTALHTVLQQVTKEWNLTKTGPTDTQIINALDTALHRLPLAPAEFVRLKEKGIASLMVYIPHLVSTLTTSKEEVSFKALLETGDSSLPPIPLDGKFDRIDFASDGSFIRVVDYKSGAPKSRNEIEGKTTDANGNYKRQLTFYALLLSLQPESHMQTRVMQLSFIEPTKGGVIKEETFVITDDEIEELKLAIIAAARVIVSGELLTLPYEPPKREKSGREYGHLIHAMFLKD